MPNTKPIPTERDPVRAALDLIWDIVHTPTKATGHRSAESHFHADFDSIRKIIKESRVCLPEMGDCGNGPLKPVYLRRWRTIVFAPEAIAAEMATAYVPSHLPPTLGCDDLPKPETMLTYASILEKPQYWVDPNGRKWLLATGEIVEAACAALRYCAALPPRLDCGADELTALHDWMREPDWAENFSLEDIANWINRRPTHVTARLAALSPRAVDGGAAGEREAAIHDALLGLIEAVELDSDTGGKGISGYTAARLHDARETLSAFPRSEG